MAEPKTSWKLELSPIESSTVIINASAITISAGRIIYLDVWGIILILKEKNMGKKSKIMVW